MKKVITICGVLVLASIIFLSCGGSAIERDAKKVAELQCSAQKLMQKAQSGDMSVLGESTRLASEAATLSREMQGKYTSGSDQKKFAEALVKEMGNCK